MLKKITAVIGLALGLSSCQMQEHEFEKYYGPYEDKRKNVDPGYFPKAYCLKNLKEIEQRKQLMKKYRDQARNGNVQDGTGETILHLAALTNSIKEIKQELANGEDIDIWTQGHSFTSIPVVDDDNKFPLVRIKEHVGYETPLHYAARGNAMAAYAYLLKRGANPNFKDSKRRTSQQILEMTDKSAL